jgi:hypothetical protein
VHRRRGAADDRAAVDQDAGREGLFVRTADPEDGRRVYIELSEEAARGLEACLGAMQRITPPTA